MALKGVKSDPLRAETELNLWTNPSSTQISVRRNGPSDLQLLCTDDSSPSSSPSFSSQQYHVRNSLFRPGVPPVTLFSRPDSRKARGGIIIGTCHFPAFSHSIVLGRGDPESHHSDVEWENLSKTSRDHSIYEFSIAIEGEGGGLERQSYRWKRTHDVIVREGGNATKWNMRSWKLEESGTRQIVAVYAANKVQYGKEAGRIKFVAGRSEEWMHWVLLTYLAVSEKARRRAMARRDISWFF